MIDPRRLRSVEGAILLSAARLVCPMCRDGAPLVTMPAGHVCHLRNDALGERLIDCRALPIRKKLEEMENS